ncbi:hypothetical protein NBRC116592_11300 [Colwellia sp. KU-HH00111]|uniref:hypothetical protein n=1 Tax=Colwellia sp. KU-HH00111 TaxID=3127652 RepID=UPI00310279CA
MKNLIILIVAAAVFLHFYPQPEVTQFYDKTKAQLLEGFAEFSDTSVRLKADKIYTDLEPQLDTFSMDEIASLQQITSSRKNVGEFYQAYCKGNKRNVVFHPANKSKVCKTIDKYQNML